MYVEGLAVLKTQETRHVPCVLIWHYTHRKIKWKEKGKEKKANGETPDATRRFSLPPVSK